MLQQLIIVYVNGLNYTFYRIEYIFHNKNNEK